MSNIVKTIPIFSANTVEDLINTLQCFPKDYYVSITYNDSMGNFIVCSKEDEERGGQDEDCEDYDNYDVDSAQKLKNDFPEFGIIEITDYNGC